MPHFGYHQDSEMNKCIMSVEEMWSFSNSQPNFQHLCMPCPSSFGRSLEWGAFTSRWQNWSWMKSCLFQFLTRFIFKIKRDIFYVGVDQVFHPLTLSQQLILGQYFKIEVSSVLLRTRYVLNTQISLFKDIFLLTTVSGAQLRT